ncbi:MAG: neutral/alkaline non-lysosomal ceramidase N-terminal domain-containing protein [Lachnospiraceae bacterium]|nr:neutral/alkaline non-lysosomal ceramidase N-terminal domain-containing protein [Lachnospiraceae bacterium]
MLKAGISRADITPPQGLELAGYPHYPRYNTGAHDPLYAACMYLENDGQEVAMVTLDLLFFSKKHVKEVRRRVEEQCGIPGSNVMISCSHTHSGPWASGRLDIESLEAGKEQPKEYVEALIETITYIIAEAKEQAFPAFFGAGYALCGAESGIGGNRRLPGGPHDPLVSVMAVKDEQDAVRGMFVNYTLHPTFIHEWSNVCTADYPCYLKMQLEEMEPGVIVGFSQGASGNQSSRYYRQGESYDEAERVGRTLGKAAHTVLDKIQWQNDIKIQTADAEVELELRDFGTEEALMAQVEQDEAVYKELYAKYGTSTNREEYYLWQNANLKLLGSEDQLGYVRMQKKGIKVELLEDEAPAEIQVFVLGGACVIGIPGEAFVEYGLYLKASAGYGVVVVNELTNGCLPGYLYTPESLVTGGYETDTSMLGEQFGRHLIDKVLDTIELLKSREA